MQTSLGALEEFKINAMCGLFLKLPFPLFSTRGCANETLRERREGLGVRFERKLHIALIKKKDEFNISFAFLLPNYMRNEPQRTQRTQRKKGRSKGNLAQLHKETV
ncbi:MAG: hypothetical protein V7K94_05040 [Nostoc sp.]|uniref:hypothetical protein n=1 Tax=Nostoc sp. TaxID=1180 RepID=UPI002FF638EE